MPENMGEAIIYFSRLSLCASDILDCNRKLMFLELDNKTTTLEYDETCKELEKLKEVEDSIKEELYKKDIDFLGVIGALILMDLNDKLKTKYDDLPELNELHINSVQFYNLDISVRELIDYRLFNIITDAGIKPELEESKYKQLLESSAYQKKIFLDILDDHIKESSEYNEYRKFYLKAKYDFAYMFESHDLNEDYTIDEFRDIYSMQLNSLATELLLIVSGFLSTNSHKLHSKDFEEKLLLYADIIRSYIVLFDDSIYESLEKSFNEIRPYVPEEVYSVFENILSFRDEDIDKFNSNGNRMKRKF